MIKTLNESRKSQQLDSINVRIPINDPNMVIKFLPDVNDRTYKLVVDIEEDGSHSVVSSRIRDNNLEDVKYLLDAGVSPNADSGIVFHFLIDSFYCQNYDIAKLLIDRGADVNYKDKYSGAPLTYLLSLLIKRAYIGKHIDDDAKLHQDDIDMIKYLLDHGAVKTEKDLKLIETIKSIYGESEFIDYLEK